MGLKNQGKSCIVYRKSMLVIPSFHFSNSLLISVRVDFLGSFALMTSSLRLLLILKDFIHDFLIYFGGKKLGNINLKKLMGNCKMTEDLLASQHLKPSAMQLLEKAASLTSVRVDFLGSLTLLTSSLRLSLMLKEFI